MAVEFTRPRRRFTADEFERMATTGVLGEDDRVELLDGEVIEMAPIGPGHAGVVNRLNRLLVSRVGDQAIVSVQNPVRLSEHSEPQPDVTVAVPRGDFFQSAHPRPEDVLLVVEVAETSAAFDREVKVPRYANAGVPEVWLVDLAAEQVEVYREPAQGGYGHVDERGRGQQLAPQALPDLTLEVTDVLGEG